jgi:putative transcriptional regulator
MTTQLYHYTESGLDNIWLENGFEYVDLPEGRHIKILDVRGLHLEIGRYIIADKKDLTGKEIKFLRKEMLMTQALLAKLLEVSEQTIHRWENGKADIPKTAEVFVRMLYEQYADSEAKINIRQHLESIADLEDKMDGRKMKVKRRDDKWQMELPLAA